MGLLDDAIREHLELKRLKGADPGDVSRKEREALGEAEPEGQAGAGAYEEDYDELQDEPVRSTQGEPAEPAGLASVRSGQETIELDMESVLATDRPSAVEPEESESETAAIGHPRHAPDPEDSLDWEMPAEQELNEPRDDVDANEDEQVEDVLEETPDFLRETPEQDRLWFEQRPPRDFDFNE
ncbi:MAG: hypothetical protein ACTHM1_04040 [Solirubrobacteraceae bacterium]